MYNHSVYASDHSEFHLGENYTKSSMKTKQFVTSIDTALFLVSGYDTQDKIDTAMKEIGVKVLKAKILVQEKNGIRIKKNGKRVQKYRNRRICLSSLSIYYHSRHIDGSTVNPHFHIVYPQNMRLGKNYMYLRFGLARIAKEYGIKFHFMDKKTTKKLKKKQEYFMRKIVTEMQRKDSLNVSNNDILNVLFLLKTHYFYSENISFFTKQLNIISRYIRKNNLDIVFDGCDLKKQELCYLSTSQIGKLMDLKEGKQVKIYFKNVLDREILKKTKGFESEVINIMSEIFDLNDIDWTKISFKIILGKKQKNNTDEKSKRIYTKYYFSATNLLEVWSPFSVPLSLIKPVLRNYKKRYSKLYRIAVFDSPYATIAVYQDGIVLKKSTNISKTMEDLSQFFNKDEYRKMNLLLTGETKYIEAFESYFKELKPEKRIKKKKTRMMSM